MTTAWKSSAWVDVSQEPRRMVLRLHGELDLETFPAIEAVIDTAIQCCPSITLDLAALTFCDSSGIAMFLRAYEAATLHGAHVELIRLSASIARVLEIAGVDAVLPIPVCDNEIDEE